MPFHRNTNYRLTKARRALFQETHLHESNFMYPLFLLESQKAKKEIKSLPDIYQLGINNILKEIEECFKIGVKSFLIFGVPNKKDPKLITSANHFLAQGIAKIKKTFGDTVVIASDICLCSYTQNGHCGIFKNGQLANDETIKILAKMASALAKAGADIVAPSAMMDGQIASIKAELDKNNLKNTLIMSYAAKFASNFYGPFRDAAECSPAFGDRKSYQLPQANFREALQKVQADYSEGSDILIVKPALAYLDIIAKVKENFNVPISAYNVSGEYAMLKKIQQKDQSQGNAMIKESLIGIKRAGADIIISYHAKEIDKILKF